MARDNPADPTDGAATALTFGVTTVFGLAIAVPQLVRRRFQ